MYDIPRTIIILFIKIEKSEITPFIQDSKTNIGKLWINS